MSALANVFWDRVFSVTGFRHADIANLRDPVNADGKPTPTDKDITETTEFCDLSWCDRAAVDKMRSDLQSYVAVLRSLKGENFARSQSRIHARNYVEDARYKGLRQREAAQRITPQKIVGMFKKLVLDESGVGSITRDEPFAALEELYISRNAIHEITFLPSELRILSACASGIRYINLAPAHWKLLFASLAANNLTSLAFVDQLPALAVLDVSYNAIADLEDVITMLDSRPELTRVDLRGNPVCLAEGYRRRLCSAVPTLVTLDGAPVTDADRTPPSRENPAITGFAPHAQAVFNITAIKDFQLALSTGDGDDAQQAAAAANAKDVKGAKAGKGADAKGKPAKGKGGAEDANAAAPTLATKRVVSLAAQWCGTAIACDDVEAAVQAVADVDAAAESSAPGGKGKTGASKDKKAAPVAAASPADAAAAAAAAGAVSGDQPGSEAARPPIVKVAWPLGGTAIHLARALVAPCILAFDVEDTTTASTSTPLPAAAGGASVMGAPPTNGSVIGSPVDPTPPSRRQRMALGTVQLDFSSIASATVGSPSPSHEALVLKAQASGALVVDPIALAERRYALDRLREELANAVAEEASLERQLTDAMRAPTPPVDEMPAAAASTKPGAKKSAPAPAVGAKGAKSSAPATLSEEAQRLQEQVAQAKVGLEERQAQIGAMQRALAAHEACAGMQVSAQVTITCGAPDTMRPPDPEPDLLAATTNGAANPKDAKKGKK